MIVIISDNSDTLTSRSRKEIPFFKRKNINAGKSAKQDERIRRTFKICS